MRFAVCDDEPFMARDIAGRISAYMSEKNLPDFSVKLFSDGRQLLDGGSFDLVFLDIQMPPPDGMKIAEALRRRGDPCLIVFVTVLRECVFDAFAVEAFDYLVKPLDEGRFERVMDRAVRALEQRAAKHLVVRRNGDCMVVPLAKIAYCEVQGRKVFIHQTDGAVIDYYERLEMLERQVGGGFFRCHRSYLVNLACVRGSREGRVSLTGGGDVPVSRLRERDLRQALLRFLREKG